MSKHIYLNSEVIFLESKEERMSKFVKDYLEMFEEMDLSDIPRYNKGVGASGYDQHSMVKAMIVYAKEGYRSIPQLIRELEAKPYLSTHVLGFRNTIPESSTFYRFLKNFDSDQLLSICSKVNVKKFNDTGYQLETLAIDSKPIVANTKENNPKCFIHNLSDKTKLPKRSEESALGFMTSTNDINGKANTIYFWGYRIHLIVDADNDTPLVWKVEPANVKDSIVAPELYALLQNNYSSCFAEKLTQTADKAYDSRNVFESFYETCHGYSAISKNSRNSKPDKELAPNGSPVCRAGFAMRFSSSWYDKKGRCQRNKFSCPSSPSECEQRNTKNGCIKYLQNSDPIKGKIECFTQAFEKVYSKRQSVERVNAFITKVGFDFPNHFIKSSIQSLVGFTMLAKALSNKRIASAKLAA
jgi:hypothetical protein